MYRVTRRDSDAGPWKILIAAGAVGGGLLVGVGSWELWRSEGREGEAGVLWGGVGGGFGTVFGEEGASLM